jgi:hypothetical protein
MADCGSGNGTTVSNQFILSGDDSLMVWGANLTVANATDGRTTTEAS